MVPGFTAVLEIPPDPPSLATPSVELAGLWDTPRGECRFARTDTFCTGFVLWCREIYLCNDGTIFGKEQAKTPYPCGGCVGVSSPSDW